MALREFFAGRLQEVDVEPVGDPHQKPQDIRQLLGRALAPPAIERGALLLGQPLKDLDQLGRLHREGHREVLGAVELVPVALRDESTDAFLQFLEVAHGVTVSQSPLARNVWSNPVCQCRIPTGRIDAPCLAALCGAGVDANASCSTLDDRPLALAPMALATDTGPVPLDAETMWKIQRVGDPALSPDGRQAVFPVTTYDEEQDKGEADLYLVPTAGGAARRLTSMPGKESEAAWSPDGRWIAFVAKRSDDKESQLYVLPTDGGEAIKVGDIPTGVSAPKWFPDSKRIAFITASGPTCRTGRRRASA